MPSEWELGSYAEAGTARPSAAATAIADMTTPRVSVRTTVLLKGSSYQLGRPAWDPDRCVAAGRCDRPDREKGAAPGPLGASGPRLIYAVPPQTEQGQPAAVRGTDA